MLFKQLGELFVEIDRQDDGQLCNQSRRRRIGIRSASYVHDSKQPTPRLSCDSTPHPTLPSTLTFEVTGTGRATVTFTYHRVVGKDGIDDGTAVDKLSEYSWMTNEETLKMNIVSSF